MTTQDQSGHSVSPAEDDTYIKTTSSISREQGDSWGMEQRALTDQPHPYLRRSASPSWSWHPGWSGEQQHWAWSAPGCRSWCFLDATCKTTGGYQWLASPTTGAASTQAATNNVGTNKPQRPSRLCSLAPTQPHMVGGCSEMIMLSQRGTDIQAGHL